MSRESTCYKLQCDPYLISVACFYTELVISVKIGEKRKGLAAEKAETFNRGSICMPSESTIF